MARCTHITNQRTLPCCPSCFQWCALVAAKEQTPAGCAPMQILARKACHAVSPARRARSSSSSHRSHHRQPYHPPRRHCRPRCHRGCHLTRIIMLARLARRRARAIVERLENVSSTHSRHARADRADPSTLRPHQMTLTVLPDTVLRLSAARALPPERHERLRLSRQRHRRHLHLHRHLTRPRHQRCHPHSFRRRPSRHRRAATHRQQRRMGEWPGVRRWWRGSGSPVYVISTAPTADRAACRHRHRCRATAVLAVATGATAGVPVACSATCVPRGRARQARGGVQLGANGGGVAATCLTSGRATAASSDTRWR